MVRGWGGGGRGPTRARGGAFTGVLATNGITISMDGKGAWRDNVFVERLWRSVKYEEVYLWVKRIRCSHFDRPLLGLL